MKFPRIMLVGKSGVGKDHFARILKRELRPDGGGAFPVLTLAFADALKEEVRMMLEHQLIALDKKGVWGVEFGEDARDLLRPLWQWYGTEFVRKNDDTYWIKKVQQKMKKHMGPIIVTDCRFKNEAWFGRNHEFIIVRVAGENRRGSYVPRHQSEDGVEKILCDYEVVNSGNDELLAIAARSIIQKAEEHVKGI